jgi:hypothetical protein
MSISRNWSRSYIAHLFCFLWPFPIIFRQLEDFSQLESRDWTVLAIFVFELIYKRVVYNEMAVIILEESIADLKSLRGRLTRKFRTLKARHVQDASVMPIKICELRGAQ